MKNVFFQLLDFAHAISYWRNMQMTNEIKTSLKREYELYLGAIAFYKNIIKQFEKKYRITTPHFLRRFESGKMGDEADYFDWYAFAKLLHEWQKTKIAIYSIVK